MWIRSLAFSATLAAAAPAPLALAQQEPPPPGLPAAPTTPAVPAAPAAGDAAANPAAPATPLSPEAEAREKLKHDADEAYRQQDFPKAIELLNQVIKDAPTDHIALYLRASAKVEHGAAEGKPELIRDGLADSIAAVKAEGKSRPDYYLPYFFGMSQLSHIEKTLDHAKAARGVADGMLKQPLKEDQRAQILYQRALLNLQMDENTPAKTDLEESVKLAPEHQAAWMALADVTARTEGFDKGLAVFQRAIEKNPRDPMLLNNRGMFLQSQGRDQEAITDFSKALEVDPKFTVALANRGYALLNGAQFEAAEIDLTKALGANPADRGVLSLRAAARMNLGKLDEAVRDCEEGIKLEPQNPLAYADLGFAQYAAGNVAGALKSFNEAQRLSPELPFLLPWRYAAAVAAKSPLPAEAEGIAKKAKDQRNWFDVLTLYLGNQATEQDLKTAIEATPEMYRDSQKSEANCFIGIKALNAGNKDAAKRAFEQSLKSKATSLSAYRVAKGMLSKL